MIAGSDTLSYSTQRFLHSVREGDTATNPFDFALVIKAQNILVDTARSSQIVLEHLGTWGSSDLSQQ